MIPAFFNEMQESKMFNILHTAEKVHRFVTIYNTFKDCSEISITFPTDFSDQKSNEKELETRLSNLGSYIKEEREIGMSELETDYLIVGSGAMGIFADTLLNETKADMVIVDRHAKPGGHWNVSYPFVRLHQPSSFFARIAELSRFEKDKVGLNKGLYDLASGAEVSSYFDDVMQQTLIPRARVTFRCLIIKVTAFSSLTGGHKTKVHFKN